ncbi:MAG: hypothetical protein SFW67_36875 [Myxococcaceae bacterium]|nr:hypothetical protein [Myxococcaceae bacterium]
MGALLLSLLLSQAPDGGSTPPLEAGPPVRLMAGAELEAGVLPSGFGGPSAGGLDVMAGLRPMLGLTVADSFSLQLGPLLRLRVIDTAPLQRDDDIGGVLRGEDWDRLGDFGELLQVLRVGADTSAFQLRAGPVHQKTLGLGHLLLRYSNRLNADARPAGATATLSVGPVKGELFAADVLAARLFAGEVTWDVGRTFSGDATVHGRYLLALSLAHDFSVGTPGRGLQVACTNDCSIQTVPPTATLAHLDASFVVLRSQALSLMGLAGLGARANQSRDLGFLAGLAMDVRVPSVELSLRAEGRKQAGGFRHGFFGAQYEVARFSGTGLGLTPLADEALPDAFSVFGEMRLRLARTVTVDGTVEHFTFGRTDFDATVKVTALDERLVAEARLGAMGLGVAPRWVASAGLRWRLFQSFYVLGSGGTVFFPQPDGTLSRGVTVSAGVGVDLER